MNAVLPFDGSWGPGAFWGYLGIWEWGWPQRTPDPESLAGLRLQVGRALPALMGMKALLMPWANDFEPTLSALMPLMSSPQVDLAEPSTRRAPSGPMACLHLDLARHRWVGEGIWLGRRGKLSPARGPYSHV